MSRFDRLDSRPIELWALAHRGDNLTRCYCRLLGSYAPPKQHPGLSALTCYIQKASQNLRPVFLLMGGHPIKLGLSRFLIDLIDRHLITHLATNGSGVIHDFELALAGGTSEDVAKWLKVGQFGLWQETSP